MKIKPSLNKLGFSLSSKLGSISITAEINEGWGRLNGVKMLGCTWRRCY
jgi:hypothetical protein